MHRLLMLFSVKVSVSLILFVFGTYFVDTYGEKFKTNYYA